jgi:peroxiredoxin
MHTNLRAVFILFAAAGCGSGRQGGQGGGREATQNSTIASPALAESAAGKKKSASPEEHPARPRPLPPSGLVGHPAPEMGVTDWIDEAGKPTKPIKMSDLRGKLVYLYCFQSWCPGCHSHGFPTLKKVSETFKGDDRVVFLAVQTVFEGFSSNTKEKMRPIQKRYGLSVPFGHDDGEKRSGSVIMERYRTRGTPWTIIIDTDGTVLANGHWLEGEEVTADFLERLKQM